MCSTFSRALNNLELGVRAARVLARSESGCSVRIVTESLKKFGLDKLDVEQRLALIEEIWNSIDAEESADIQMSDAQRAELGVRLLDDDANPDDLVSWESIKTLSPPAGGK